MKRIICIFLSIILLNALLISSFSVDATTTSKYPDGDIIYMGMNNNVAKFKLIYDYNLSSINGGLNYDGWYNGYIQLDNENCFEVAFDKDSHPYLNVETHESLYGPNHKISRLCINSFISTVKGLKSKEYTGKPLTQSLSVSSKGKTASFNCSYSNNVKIGTAKVRIYGIGTTVGELTKSFKIVPSKISKISVKKKGKKSILAWSTSKGAKNYVIQKKVGKTWKTMKTVKKSIKKYSVPSKNTYRVYGFTKIGKTSYKSPTKTITVK